METITLYYTETASQQGFTIAEPTSTGLNSEEGFFEAGIYKQAEYILPEGFRIAETQGGDMAFFRGDEHFALISSNNKLYPILVNGHEEIALKRA